MAARPTLPRKEIWNCTPCVSTAPRKSAGRAPREVEDELWAEGLGFTNPKKLDDAEKTKGAQHPGHPNWSTLGDVGYVDAEGYLYLTDRKAFMIISGGVNIYPQEIEDCLIMHPGVSDVEIGRAHV